ncbi:MAG TPA: flagellar hook-associated protein FlgL [Solirubrobacteraceae bacterium]|jgi:flagellar hook-associated protein 3 FlgL|nr:flagellar hook-associated protein FlgL [Solirubrobacteraceae bacterium]
MTTRITAGMVQRSILADLNKINDKLAQTQAKAASGKEITKPSDDPFGAARAMALRQEQSANAQHQRNVQDARGWQDTTETALSSMTDAIQRARDLVTQGSTDSADQTSRDAIASELEQLLAGIKQDANATYNGAYVFGGTKTDSAPYADADDAYHGDRAGAVPALAGDPATGIVRQIGPGVSVSINIVGSDLLGDGTSGDGKLISTLRDTIAHLRSGDGSALRNTDLKALDGQVDSLLAVRARNGAQSNRLDSALTRLQQVSEVTNRQLSDTEDADIAKTLIDLNSQSAAYSAALRSGATIVQTSLMDFLR